jgi:hypothetical protein
VLAPKLKQPDRQGLVLLTPLMAERAVPGDPATSVRLCLRKWESRLAWVGRALIAISFPMAYLLLMLGAGSPAPLAARIVSWLWLAALAAALVCAEALWRNRGKLERLAGEPPASPRN